MREKGYKNRIAHVIIFALTAVVTVVISAGILTGCGRDPDEKEGTSGEESVIGALTREDTAEEESDGYVSEGAGEAVEADKKPSKAGMTEDGSSEEAELDWITLEEMLRPSVLRITCGGYSGSGVVWEITEDEVRVVSSGHLLKYGETCEVECYAGIYYEAKVEKVLEDCDIGFAVFPVKALREDEVELAAVKPCVRNAEELVRGEELVIYGSMDYVVGNFVKGYVIEAEYEIQIEGYAGEESLLLGGILQEENGAGEDISDERNRTDIERPDGEKGGADRHDTAGSNGDSGEMSEKGAVDAGMSGSGVFDRQGYLLGILAGGDGKEGFAAVPVWKFAGK